MERVVSAPDDGIDVVAVVGPAFVAAQLSRRLRQHARREGWDVEIDTPHEPGGYEDVVIVVGDAVALPATESSGGPPVLWLAPAGFGPSDVGAFLRGGNGLIRDDATTVEIAVACRALRAGLAVLSPGFAAAATEPAVDLTVAERAVYDAVRSGRTNREIGELLGISINTVKFHLAAIYEKLGVHNRTEAVARLSENVIL